MMLRTRRAPARMQCRPQGSPGTRSRFVIARGIFVAEIKPSRTPMLMSQLANMHVQPMRPQLLDMPSFILTVTSTACSPRTSVLSS